MAAHEDHTGILATSPSEVSRCYLNMFFTYVTLKPYVIYDTRDAPHEHDSFQTGQHCVFRCSYSSYGYGLVFLLGLVFFFK